MTSPENNSNKDINIDIKIDDDRNGRRNSGSRKGKSKKKSTSNSEYEYHSHAKPLKIYWGKLIGAVIVFIILAALITEGVLLAINRFEEDKRLEAAEHSSTVASTSVSKKQTTTIPELNTGLTKITPSATQIYLAEGKSKKISLSFDADISNDLKNLVWSSDNENVATVDKDGNVKSVKAGNCKISAVYGKVEADINVTVRKLEEKDGITYVDGIMVANKEYSLPKSYDPEGILPEVQDAFDKLSADAAKKDLNIYIGSSYRSYSDQVAIFNNYVDMYGEDIANVFSSKPGYSEHQTGMTIDVNTIDSAFGHTPESDWLAEHAADYGFIVRYPKGKESITGYEYEPWHIRYLGVDTAKKVKKTGLCLEEYLGIDDQTYTFPKNFDYENMEFKEQGH